MVRTHLQVNKNSHQISKPIGRSNSKPLHLIPPPPPPLEDAEPASGANFPATQGEPNHTQHPPVYNINKDDFRDVVQRLTGSQHRLGPTTPPPPPPPPSQSQTRPPSSRLQRIRPPPLSQIGNRSPMPQVPSPLPPLPSVHSSAESPISAYLRRCFHNTNPNLPMESPVTAYMRSIIQQTQAAPSSSAALPPPPRVLSPCGMSTAGYGLPPPPQQTPLSPAALPVPSPRWKAL